MRGTVDAVTPKSAMSGIIPACAGNSRMFLASPRKYEDHPRVCGEQLWKYPKVNKSWGSSPRVRGTESHLLCFQHPVGIIPACAGNRAGRRHALGTCWDHPRVCGEQLIITELLMLFSGSSPRVRGTVPQTLRIGCLNGIIPACAGNSSMSSCMRDASRDHPRVCGEQWYCLMVFGLAPGSSPRVRGTGTTCLCKLDSLGIIPACAGNRSQGLLQVE